MRSEDVMLWLKERVGKKIHLHDTETIECIATTLVSIDGDLQYLDNMLEVEDDTSRNV